MCYNSSNAEKDGEEQIRPVENIGPASQTTEPTVPIATGILAGKYFILLFFFVLLGLHGKEIAVVKDVNQKTAKTLLCH